MELSSPRFLQISTSNKIKIIDTIIILKLLIKKLNFEFPNNFYEEWVLYLIPVIDFNSYQRKNKFTYYDSDLANSLISRYNIKHKLFKVFDKNYITNDNSIDLVNTNYISNNIRYIFEFRRDSYERKKIIILKIDFIDKYQFTVIDKVLHSFLFEIPEDNLDLFNKKIWSYNEFNNLIVGIWADNQGLIMTDYVFSAPMKKIIYFDLFKKILLRIIVKMQSCKILEI
jgi:hypothetical protein